LSATARPAEEPRHKLYLIDGSGYIFRAYHALPPLTRKKDGLPVGAVSGFCNILNRFLEEAESDRALSHLAVVFDAGRRTFRNDIYPEYKAHRPEAPEDLVPQFPLTRDAVRAFNTACIEKEGFEADDVIATLARRAVEQGIEVVIVSSDKDLMQLVRPGVSMFDPVKQKPMAEAEVREKFGVGPERVVDVQSLAGDSTDNVPGVPGIGIKTAAELINTYGDLDTLLARAGEIKQPKRRENLLANAALARISRDLVRLKDDVPLEESLDDFRVRPLDRERLFAFLDDMELRTLKTRVMSRLGAAGRGGDTDIADVHAAAATADSAPAVPVPPAEAKYELVQDEAALAAWVARAQKAGVVAVDTETNSLHAVTCDLVGVSLAVAPGRACYIPVSHRNAAAGALDLGGGEAVKQVPKDRVIALLKPLLEDPAVLKVGHNIKYDLVVLAACGIDVAPVDDTMLMSSVLDGGLHGHGMDELSELFLQHKTITFAEVCGTGKAQITFDLVPLDKAMAYAAEDADITLRLHRALKPRLVPSRVTTLYETAERPLAAVIAAMERAGIKVDTAELARLSADFAGRMAALEKEIHALAGEPFNVGSPKQLGEILFDKMSLPGGKKMKTGAWGTGADVLEALAAQGHALPQKVLDWRQLSKLKSTYTDSLQQEINAKTGRVHTCYGMAATPTGRLSSTEPNLQNIPVRTDEGRRIRRAFVAEPGHVLISADYSQIELRLLAHIADIPSLKQAFRDGVDIHALTASQVFNVPVEGMDPMVRRSAKAINFGIIYGMSAFGLAQQLGIAQGEAKAYIDAYFARYPGIRDYMEATRRKAREQGFVTTIFGRRCHVPEINSKNPAMRGFQERAAINYPLQGSAADIIKRAMARLPAALEAAGLKARMLLQVHDELVFEASEAEAARTMDVARTVMQGAAQLSVPLVVEAGQGKNWGEAH
jgi:DNA polymerase-1